MKQIRKRLTYANVMSSLAVFLVLGGATALAAGLGKNTVGTKQLKKNAVVAAKVKNGAITAAKIAAGAVGTTQLGNAAVTSEKLADNAVNGAKVQDGSLTGTDINQASLTSVKAANVYATEFDEGPNTVVHPSDPGIKSGGCFFVCIVEFPRDVSQCSSMATPVGIPSGSGEASFAEASPSAEANKVIVEMFNKEGNITAHDFSLTVICPTTS